MSLHDVDAACMHAARAHHRIVPILPLVCPYRNALPDGLPGARVDNHRGGALAIADLPQDALMAERLQQVRVGADAASVGMATKARSSDGCSQQRHQQQRRTLKGHHHAMPLGCLSHVLKERSSNNLHRRSMLNAARGIGRLLMHM